MTFGFCTISPPTKSDFVLCDKILKRLFGQNFSKRWVFFWQYPSNLQSEIPPVSFVIHLDRALYLSVMFLQNWTFGFIGSRASLTVIFLSSQLDCYIPEVRNTKETEGGLFIGDWKSQLDFWSRFFISPQSHLSGRNWLDIYFPLHRICHKLALPARTPFHWFHHKIILFNRSKERSYSRAVQRWNEIEQKNTQLKFELDPDLLIYCFWIMIWSFGTVLFYFSPCSLFDREVKSKYVIWFPVLCIIIHIYILQLIWIFS